jgi:hypothetical protein
VYFGYGDISSYRFLQAGVFWVLACSLAFCVAFIIGARRGGRAAARYVTTSGWVFVAGMVAIAAWALISGQLGDFVLAFGVGVLIELLMFAAGCIGIMWFMPMQYARSRILIDEKFGSREALRRAKEDAKRAQEAAYRASLERAAGANADADVPQPGEPTEPTEPTEKD